MNNEYQDFMNEIKSLINQEVDNKLKNNGFYRCIPAIIIYANENSTFNVDAIDTTINNLMNKTGEELKIGDSVLVMEKYGSNYSNCFIFAKCKQQIGAVVLQSSKRKTWEKIGTITNRTENFSNDYFTEFRANNIILEPNVSYLLSFDYIINSKTASIAASVGSGTNSFVRDIKQELYPNQTIGTKDSVNLIFTPTQDQLSKASNGTVITTPYLWLRVARTSTPATVNVSITNISISKEVYK